MPFVVILPGIAAVALLHQGVGYSIPLQADGSGPDYNLVLTTLMAKFYPSGMLGIGLTALMASFMSGMAGTLLRLIPSSLTTSIRAIFDLKRMTLIICGWDE